MKRIISTILSTVLISSAVVIAPITSALAANVGSTGSFSKVEKATTGKATIVHDGGRNYVELSADFETSKDGPDLKVVLSPENIVPLHLKGKTYLNLGALKTFKGVQRYEIPSDVNLKEIQSVAIWCEQFDATFGYAPLPIADLRSSQALTGQDLYVR
ncbi:DM13 domain-containing protein (plasmid) [Pseudanabaena biceps]|nr:DM13 domain-containing protein [Pseudanabaena biceps]